MSAPTSLAERDPAVVSLVAVAGAVRTARRHTQAQLEKAGCDPDVIADAVVIISELVTNAVKYASGEDIEVWATVTFGLVLLAVWDPIDAKPASRKAADDDESGRGLFIVKNLSLDSGVLSPSSGGKTVWAILTMNGEKLNGIV